MLTAFVVVAIVIVLVIVLYIARHKLTKFRQINNIGKGEDNNRQVYVGNLSYQVTEKDLNVYFSQYGAIEQVRIVKNYNSGKSKGFGFVTYRSAAEAQKALVAHGQKYQGRAIVVRIAKPR